MALTVYSTDEDLVAIRPNILSLGVDSWSGYHEKTFRLVNRTISRRWYQTACTEYSLDWRDTGFSPDLVEEDSLKDLACFKTLELAYLYLMKDSKEPDGFEREMHLFRKLYNQELEEVLSTGISYDWDGSGAIVDDERYQRNPRRLIRV